MSFGFSVGDFIVVLQLADTIRKRFVDSPDQFKGISNELQSLSTVLENFEIRGLTDREKASLRDVLTGCRNTLSALENELAPYEGLDTTSSGFGDGFRRARRRLKWDEKKIGHYRSRITANISLLNAFSINSISKVSSAINVGVSRLNQRHEDQEREKEQREVTEWLTPIDYSKQHNDFIARRLEGTGKALLNSMEFQAWLSTNQRTLFCPGIPGAGKTMISCIVIDELWAKFNYDTTVGIAYVYCNYRQHLEQRPQDLLLSILKQLSQRQSCIPEEVRKLYEYHQSDRSRPTTNEVRTVLHSIIQSYSRVYIVIDALDECHSSNEGRYKLLSEILNLRNQTHVNLFATSRFVPEIISLFDGCEQKEIRAARDDVQSYVNARIPQLLRYRISKYPDLQDAVRTAVVAAMDGMFLLAKLHMDSLSSKPTPGDIKQALKSLKSLRHGVEGLGTLYEQAMNRIESQDEDSRALAKQVLSWVTHARRPLTAVELQHALAVRKGTVEFDEDFIPEVEDLVSICAGLITTDSQSGLVRWIHYTTQEYFERTCGSWFPQAQEDIALTCLAYLSFDTFASGFSPSVEELYTQLRLNTLYDYAARNWGHHAGAADPSTELDHAMLCFFNAEGQVAASTQIVMHLPALPLPSQDVNQKVTGLHLAAYFGLDRAMSALLSDCPNPDVQDFAGRTPLSWAAERGQERIVRLLLETGKADVDSTDAIGRTPLWEAAGNGQAAVVKLLLETGRVNVEIEDDSGRSPALMAAAGGFEPVVRLLLETGGADAESKDSNGQTLLSVAAMEGHEAVVRLLLETGKVDADSKDNFCGQTPLSWAAEEGHAGIVKLLLETGKVDVDSKDLDFARTPLMYAAKRGNEAVVKLLLETGKVDVNWRDSLVGHTPLSWAAKEGHVAVVKLLLETGKVDVDSVDRIYGQTPLSWAAERGHDAVVKLLLDTGKVDADSKDALNQTPLSRAAKKRHTAVVNLLSSRVL